MKKIVLLPMDERPCNYKFPKRLFENEEINIVNYYNKLDIKEESRVIFNLPKENSIRTIIKYLKLKETSSKYPRRYSEIIKKDI